MDKKSSEQSIVIYKDEEIKAELKINPIEKGNEVLMKLISFAVDKRCFDSESALQYDDFIIDSAEALAEMIDCLEISVSDV